MKTSKELKECQSTLESLVKGLIDDPMTDYPKVTLYLKIIKDIDTKRRERWNKEKFGSYEDLADEVLNFNSDDIPF